jgi:hypothetical protein
MNSSFAGLSDVHDDAAFTSYYQRTIDPTGVNALSSLGL